MSDDRLTRAQETDKWTVGALHDHFTERMDTLERHIDERFDSQDEATRRALESAEKAVLKAESLASTRAENQNEWRATVGDLMATKLDRSEYETAHAALVKELSAAIKYQNLESGQKQGQHDTTARTIAVVGSVGWLVMLILEHAFR